ncbi:MAG: hypothetical protein P8N76_08110 [Pirellulaceae bacterium]|nr:hypothetical protein [Planctomycetaceae bacterium]MDG2381624.1 hypothetical protein [Pirellulaceae bacterium]
MFKTNRYFVVSILSFAVFGLSYAVIHASAVSSSLANQVLDEDADQLVGGDLCVRLRKGRCSAYFAKPGGKWGRQVCPNAQRANIMTGINCGTRYFAGVTACGGAIPDNCRVAGARYAFGGRCIKIATTPGCVGDINVVPVRPVPTCP